MSTTTCLIGIASRCASVRPMVSAGLAPAAKVHASRCVRSESVHVTGVHAAAPSPPPSTLGTAPSSPDPASPPVAPGDDELELHAAPHVPNATATDTNANRFMVMPRSR